MEPVHHIVIPESQDGPAETGEVRVSSKVFVGSPGVPDAVNLDAEPRFNTGEVEEEAINRVLSSKFEAIKSGASQVPPQRHFVSGVRASQLPRSLRRFRHDSHWGLLSASGVPVGPSPQPSPRGGEG